MKEEMITKLMSLKKTTEHGEEYYLATDIPELLDESTPSISTFRRRTKEHAIRQIQIAGLQERAYRAEDIRKFLQGELNLKRGGARRGKSFRPRSGTATPIEEKILIDVGRNDNLGYAYLMEVGLVDVGVEHALPARTILTWLKKNSEVYWLAQNPHDQGDIWATLAALPLPEEKVWQLMHKEITLEDITYDDVLSYQSGASYSFYISALAKEGRYSALKQLLQHLFALWRERPSQLGTRRLFFSTPYSSDESPLSLMAHEFFTRLYEPNNHDTLSWILDLDDYNPSPEIQTLQKFLKKEGNESFMLTIPRTRKSKEKVRDLRNFRPRSNPRFRPASTDKDLLAIERINRDLFGASKSTDEELVRIRRSHLQRNPEMIHVLEIDGRVVGFFIFYALPMSVRDQLIRAEIRVSQVKPEDIIPFHPGQPVDLFVQSIAIDPTVQDKTKAIAGSELLRGIINMFYEWGTRGIEIHAVYGRSDTSDGINTSKGLGFKEIIPSPAKDKHVFILDVAESDQPFLINYMQALEEYRKAHSEIA